MVRSSGWAPPLYKSLVSHLAAPLCGQAQRSNDQDMNYACCPNALSGIFALSIEYSFILENIKPNDDVPCARLIFNCAV